MRYNSKQNLCGELTVRYFIEYAVLCDKGKIRINNQDNFWCAGDYLESENNGLDTPISGTHKELTTGMRPNDSSKAEEIKSEGGKSTKENRPMFAIFDGMGGESCGEMASYLAAKAFDSSYYNNSEKITEQFLYDVCEIMNSCICSYSDNNFISHMGTTAAILAFDEKDVYICNLGDSKIFRFSSRKLTQITHDHVITAPYKTKSALTQCLGIPKTEFIIEPYIAKGNFVSGDRYLICSDGLTDMLTEDEISTILSKKKNTLDCASTLVDSALSKGGVDNITVILCDVHKESSGFLDIFPHLFHKLYVIIRK